MGAEGWKDPFRRVYFYRVAVTHDEQRSFRTVALQPGNDVGASRVLRGQGDRNALSLQHFLQIIGNASFIPGRICAVDLYQSLEMAQGFAVDFCPVGSLGGSGETNCAIRVQRKNVDRRS